jgi:hypothetical protein
MAAVLALASVSKTPYYIAGAVLVVWALLLAAYGITHPEFPGASKVAYRGVIVLSAALAAATIAMAIHTATFGA